MRNGSLSLRARLFGFSSASLLATAFDQKCRVDTTELRRVVATPNEATPHDDGTARETVKVIWRWAVLLAGFAATAAWTSIIGYGVVRLVEFVLEAASVF